MARRLLLVLGCLLAPGLCPAAEKRPNILWLTCEDISPNLGCYGDKDAITPHLDKLAREGIRYTRAFSVAGVCAPSRSCLITGMYPSTLGSHFMRCETVLPAGVTCFTEYLRKVGYYCSNNAKQDYNFETPAGAWNESSRKAHWRNRKKGQPCFSVFNNLVTHESQIRTTDAVFLKQTARVTAKERHDPAKIRIPPFHPDTPEVRRDWARHFDTITAMDKWVGDFLAQLQTDGLSDDTIVFFFSDHGVGLPRGKRWLYDTGLRVPLLVRFGRSFSHLAPAKPGAATDRLVSFVDFAPTVLSLAGLKPAEKMQGLAFLGKSAKKPRQAVFGIRDRMDERNDCTRAVRDGRFKYIRNYHPYKPWAQPIAYMELMPTMSVWRRLQAEGKLTGPASLWMRPTKPAEELYDTQDDPHEVRNLIDKEGVKGEARAALTKLRKLHLDWMKETRDLGLLPEAEVFARSRGRTPYELGLDEKLFPRAKLLRAAQTVSLEELRKLLADRDSAVRWWGATGLGVHGGKSQAARETLTKALKDAAPGVRVAAAAALTRVGKAESGLPVLIAALVDKNPWVRHEAALALDEMGEKARPARRALMDSLVHESNEYVVRVVRTTLVRLAEKERR